MPVFGNGNVSTDTGGLSFNLSAFFFFEQKRSALKNYVELRPKDASITLLKYIEQLTSANFLVSTLATYTR